MKKLVVLAMTAIMAVSMSLTAFAAPSVSGDVPAGEITATDANGAPVEVSRNVAEYDAAAAETYASEAKSYAVEALGEKYAVITEPFDEQAPTNWVPGMKVQITYAVPGVSAENVSKVRVLHKGSNGWEDITKSHTADGVVAEFTEFSPVTFVMEVTEQQSKPSDSKGDTWYDPSVHEQWAIEQGLKPAPAADAAKTVASPKTGESNAIVVVELLAVAFAVSGLVVLKRSKEA